MNEFIESVETFLASPLIDPWGYVFSIVFATLLVRFFARGFLDRIARQLAKTHNLYDDALLEAARRPIGWGIWILGLLLAAEIAFAEDSELGEFIDAGRYIAIIFLVAWFANRFINFVEEHVADPEYSDKPVDQTTATAIGKLLRASVIITAILMVLQNLGFSISGVLAFGGIGGIAIGFAARDLLANFFGAIMIYWDRPFAVGDWIRSPDREIEGTVEDIGWRLTIIRTFDQRPLYVPNAIFASLSVENPSRMRNRRIYEIVGLRYDDFDVLPAVVTDIRTMLKEHPAIDLERTLMVNVLQFGESTIDIMIYTFTKTTVWTEFHEIKEEILIKIGNIIAAHGAEIAFPTQTIHLPSAEPGDVSS